MRFFGAAVGLCLVTLAVSALPQEPSKKDSRTVIKLPGPVDATTLGGGGRYLILALPKARQIAVLDITQSLIVRFLPMADDAVIFAAGEEFLFVYLQNQNLLQRWSLATFEINKTVPLDLGKVTGIAMGAASKGPLAVVANKMVTFYEAAKLMKVAEFKAHRYSNGGDPDGVVAASADGLFFEGSNGAFVVEDGVITARPHHIVHPPTPSADGALGIARENVFRSDDPDRASVYRQKSGQTTFFVPTPSPAYFAGVRDYFRRNNDFGAPPSPSLDVFNAVDLERVFTLTGFDELKPPSGEPQGFNSKREPAASIFLFPDSGALVTIGAVRDELVLRPVDFAAEIERHDPDYLLVTSRPPARIRKGLLYRYPIQILSKHGGLICRLESGPPGMDVSVNGIVTWKTPAEGVSRVGVLIAIEDAARRQIYQAFTIELQ